MTKKLEELLDLPEVKETMEQVEAPKTVVEVKKERREGSGTSVTVINQESKEHIQASSFSYTQNELLVVTLSDVDFLNSIEETTTLSVILYDNNIPLYRDIVRFSGEMNTAKSSDKVPF